MAFADCSMLRVDEIVAPTFDQRPGIFHVSVYSLDGGCDTVLLHPE